MKAKIYVNRHRVRENNKKAKEIVDKINESMMPCIGIKTYKGVDYVKKASLGNFIIQQDWESPPCNGAKIWITGPRESIIILDD